MDSTAACIIINGGVCPFIAHNIHRSAFVDFARVDGRERESPWPKEWKKKREILFNTFFFCSSSKLFIEHRGLVALKKKSIFILFQAHYSTYVYIRCWEKSDTHTQALFGRNPFFFVVVSLTCTAAAAFRGTSKLASATMRLPRAHRVRWPPALSF